MATDIESDDPLAGIMTAHLARMQEISTAGLEHSKQISDHATSEFKRFAGVRSSALTKLLEAVGIVPAEAATDAPDD